MISLEDLLKRLPSNYIKTTTSNLAKLLSIIKDEANKIYVSINQVESASKIEEATGKSLDRIGANVQQTRGELPDDIYRILIKSKIQSNLSPGDINSLIEYIATLLQIDREDVEIIEPSWGSFHFSSTSDSGEIDDRMGFDAGVFRSGSIEPARIEVGVPPETINDKPLSWQNFIDIVKQLVAAGVRVSIDVEGTFAFSSTLDSGEIESGAGFGSGTFGAYYEPSDDLELPI